MFAFVESIIWFNAGSTSIVAGCGFMLHAETAVNA
jgi:hypothetical protein